MLDRSIHLGVRLKMSHARKVLGSCALVSALLFSAQALAQPAHYQWEGGGGNNSWQTVGNWRVNNAVPAQRPGLNTATRSDRATIDGDYTVTNIGNIVFQGADNANKLGVFNALELLNGAKLSTSSALRVTGDLGVTRNVVIDSESSLTSTASANGLQMGSVSGNVGTWTIAGTVSANSALFYMALQTSADNGGLMIDLTGGRFEIANATNWANSTYRTDGIAQINISGGGFLSLGVMSNFDHSSNAFVNFVDGTGEFNFLYGSYTTIGSVETLITHGKIRLGGNVVDSSAFTINDTGSGWQVQVVPEPSTYALLAGITTLGAAAFMKRRRR